MNLGGHRATVRPELVEGLAFLAAQKEGQGFDKLSPNGFGLGSTCR
jgi:hypothetical protein